MACFSSTQLSNFSEKRITQVLEQAFESHVPTAVPHPLNTTIASLTRPRASGAISRVAACFEHILLLPDLFPFIAVLASAVPPPALPAAAAPVHLPDAMRRLQETFDAAVRENVEEFDMEVRVWSFGSPGHASLVQLGHSQALLLDSTRLTTYGIPPPVMIAAGGGAEKRD